LLERFDPDLVLFAVLPPLLYSAALDSSSLAMRRNARAIGLLAIGLPLATTAVVGAVAYLTIPQFPLAAALVLGAVVAPPDAVSASAIGRRLGLPRRIMTLLGGESLLNDATALTAYRVVQEGVVNALRHAKARRIAVRARVLEGESGGETVSIVIEDDGKGCGIEGPVPGFGLRGMRERLEASHGTLAFQASSSGGLILEAQLPLEEAR
jgi:hypothetical protein